MRGISRGPVNEDWEILANAHAVAYDSANMIMMSGPQKYNYANIKAVEREFSKLKKVASKNCPECLRDINQLEDLTAKHIAGKISDKEYLRRIRAVSHRHGVNTQTIDAVEGRINQEEMFRPGLMLQSRLAAPQSKGHPVINRRNINRFAFNNFGRKCDVCNTPKKLEIHHRNNNPRDNSILNLRVLCHSDHSKLTNTKNYKINTSRLNLNSFLLPSNKKRSIQTTRRIIPRKIHIHAPIQASRGPSPFIPRPIKSPFKPRNPFNFNFNFGSSDRQRLKRHHRGRF